MKKGLTRKNKKGFTLIELVVVIAILGILAAILIPVIGGFIETANKAADLSNARMLYSAGAMTYASTSNTTAFATAQSIDAYPATGTGSSLYLYTGLTAFPKGRQKDFVGSSFTCTVDSTGKILVGLGTLVFDPLTGTLAAPTTTN